MIWTIRKCILMKLYALTSLIYSTSAIEPLIFNPYTLDVFNVRAMYFHKSGSSIYAAACPFVDGGYEEDFNSNYSLGRKSLLLRGELREEYEDVMEIQCEKSFELSIVELYDSLRLFGTRKLKIGYEVFFDKSQYPNDFTISHYFEFGKNSEVFDNGFKHIRNVFVKFIPPKMDEENKDEEARSSGEKRVRKQKMGLMWFTKIDLEYNFKSWSIRNVKHKMHRHADQLQQNVQCANYDLGDELYENETLDDFYTVENQRSIFDEVALPQSILPGGDCLLKRVCVEKYNFVPSYVFQSSVSSPVSCSNLTTVPIWREVSKSLLDQLDKFLVAMAQFTERRIEIISSVHETLTFHATTSSNELKPLYLDSKNSRIPIPKLLYKIIRFKSYPCKQNETTCIYDVLIVIHNEPNFNVDDQLCLEDKCLEWGWERIQKYYSSTDNEWKKSKHIYCCKLNDRIEKKLGMSREKFKYGDLDLKHFPYDNEYTIEHTILDRQKLFETLMDKLFPTNGSVDWTSIPFLKFTGEDYKIPLPAKKGVTNLARKINFLDKRMEKLLNFNRNEKIKSRDLNLKEFPVYNESTGQHETATKQYEFEQNMYHLLHKYYPELV